MSDKGHSMWIGPLEGGAALKCRCGETLDVSGDDLATIAEYEAAHLFNRRPSLDSCAMAAFSTYLPKRAWCDQGEDTRRDWRCVAAAVLNEASAALPGTEQEAEHGWHFGPVVDIVHVDGCDCEPADAWTVEVDPRCRDGAEHTAVTLDDGAYTKWIIDLDEFARAVEQTCDWDDTAEAVLVTRDGACIPLAFIDGQIQASEQETQHG